jgi:uncharacterized protein YqhQ
MKNDSQKDRSIEARADCSIDFAVGGQAVIEGVMMRSPHFYTVSVRDKDGKIHMMQKRFESLTKRAVFGRVKIFGVPIVRGIVHLIESMAIGFKALNYSNSIFLGEDLDEDGSPEARKERGMAMKILFGILGFLYVVGTLAFAIFLLKFLPLWVAEKAAETWAFVETNYLVFNAIDGLTKITIFLGYILLISLMKDIRRVFEYHGAEHKAIWAYEASLELTVKNAGKQTRFHPRCGTSFIFIVILMSILIYTVIPPADGFWLKLGDRLMVIPVIAGLSYELLKLSAKFSGNAVVRAFTWPGLWIQRLTTREPDDSQLEIALHSLKESLKVEGDENQKE